MQSDRGVGRLVAPGIFLFPSRVFDGKVCPKKGRCEILAIKFHIGQDPKILAPGEVVEVDYLGLVEEEIHQCLGLSGLVLGFRTAFAGDLWSVDTAESNDHILPDDGWGLGDIERNRIAVMIFHKFDIGKIFIGLWGGGGLGHSGQEGEREAQQEEEGVLHFCLPVPDHFKLDNGIPGDGECGVAGIYGKE